MKKPTKLVICSSLTLALALAIWSPVQAQTAQPTEGKKMMEGKQMMPGKMMESCQAMKEQKEKMMADMKAQDAALTEEVAQMNRAPDNAKMSLMATVITHMQEQRTVMNARKAKMDEAMMQHMMQHMQMGQESMAQCPMMKGMAGMKGMDEKSGNAPEKQM
jgi:hypothetical protein